MFINDFFDLFFLLFFYFLFFYFLFKNTTTFEFFIIYFVLLFYFFFIFYFFDYFFFTWYFLLLVLLSIVVFSIKLLIVYLQIRAYLLQKYIFPLLQKYIFPLLQKYIFPLLQKYIFPFVKLCVSFFVKFFFYYFFLIFFSLYLFSLLFTLYVIIFSGFIGSWFGFLVLLDDWLSWSKFPPNYELMVYWACIMFYSLYFYSFFYFYFWSFYFKSIRKFLNTFYKNTQSNFIFFLLWYFEKFWLFFMFLFFSNISGILIYVTVLGHVFWEIQNYIILLNFFIIIFFNLICLFVFFYYLFTCSNKLSVIRNKYRLNSIFYFHNHHMYSWERESYRLPSKYTPNIILLKFILTLFVYISKFFGYDCKQTIADWYDKNQDEINLYALISNVVVLYFLLVLFLITYLI